MSFLRAFSAHLLPFAARYAIALEAIALSELKSDSVPTRARLVPTTIATRAMFCLLNKRHMFAFYQTQFTIIHLKSRCNLNTFELSSKVLRVCVCVM